MEDLARREEQVRQLGEHMMQVEEEERRRISRELHDEAGQSLLCIRLKLEMLGKTAPEPLRQSLAETRELTERTIAEIRRIIAALSPGGSRTIGLGGGAPSDGQPVSRHLPGPGAARLIAGAARPRYPGNRNRRIPPGAGMLPQYRQTF